MAAGDGGGSGPGRFTLALAGPDGPPERRDHVGLEQVCSARAGAAGYVLREELLRFVDRVADVAAARHGVTRALVYGRSRMGPVVRARHEVWCVLRADYGWSLPAIAHVFGVDHTTVLAATRTAHRPTRVRVAVPPLVRYRIG